ncbi:NADH-quinone oxidoreductase subunit M [Tychonema sp. LEGE 07199]|uniref:NADH-quinone oxidoreductase subunit M n=1 Tax=unclassified Tychonema TaxID=2642144 RepID=UPI001882CAEB|nr:MULTISPECIES: NADH-quinone oxidoreductase subunit M [unclassified Tychonema]MBE9121503.1 NADH-quinone oxidoreductase subunit M [Tychonema sp. LEGE 07199]MBE9130330.1 NADH-quinone oxidoreductase subunit M [Tychonema sp. LEGE 07196]
MLSALIWIPMLTAALIGFWPSAVSSKVVRNASLVIAGVTFILSVIVAAQFDISTSQLQFSEFVPWLDTLGLNYNLGVDGLSLPLVILNTLLTGVAIYATDDSIRRPRLYYSLMLLISGGVTGAFLSQNLLLFFLFFEVELIPLYLLIAIWGGERRGYAATKFLIYTAFSGMVLLASFLGVVWLSGASSFDMVGAAGASHLQGGLPLPLVRQLVLLSGVLLAFGIKIPLVPFHTWLPDAHVEASTPVSVLLAGVLLKLGTYGMLRFGLGLFPDAWAVAAPWLASWAVVSVIYGASCAIAQKDMKKIVAYSSIAHMGYILLASAAATEISTIGTVLQMVSHGLISGLLFLSVGIVYKKSGSRNIDVLKGLFNPDRGLPMIGSLMILGVMGSAGIPGLSGFIAEFLIFRGSLPVFPVQTVLCMIGTGLTSVYFLIMVNRAFFGRLSDLVVNLPQVRWRDRIPSLVLAVIIAIMGVQPGVLVALSEKTAIGLVSAVPAQVQQVAHNLE